MHIVAMAWLYVVGIAAATQPGIATAVLTFLGYGLLPLAIILWLKGGGRRQRQSRDQRGHNILNKSDRGDSGHDQ